MKRFDGRSFNENRTVKITNDYLMHPTGSVLIEVGNTKVICSAFVEEKVPPFLKGQGVGWVTAEYSMLPGSTNSRKIRDSAKGKIDGRTMEIQRLIGRSLRSVVDMKKLGERTIWLDCDVIQADGGTRTASITGAFVALVEAMKKLKEQGILKEIPITSYVSAVSVGLIEEGTILDLCYEEDSRAIVDMNVVVTSDGRFIEIQGTGEERPFSRTELNGLLELAEAGARGLMEKQKEIIQIEI